MKFLRWCRILVSLAVFVAISVQFLDIYHALPDVYYVHHPAKFQFIPSLLNLLGTFSVLSGAAFITFTIGALLFGRAYCSCFCPFGILMDFARWIAKRFAPKKMHLHFAPAWNTIRMVFVCIAAVCIVFGYTAMLGLIDPYSLYGKIFGSVMAPAASEAANMASSVLMNIGYYSLGPVNGEITIALPVFGFALLILFGISAVSILNGRLYCNTVCPVGGFLGWFAKHAVFQLRLAPNHCRSCGLCEQVCKAQCIDSKRRYLDFSRCVLCFDCGKVCTKQHAVRFHFAYADWFRKKKDPEIEKIENTSQPKNADNTNGQTHNSPKPSSERTASVNKVAPMDRRAFVRTAPALAVLFCTAGKVKENTQLPMSPNSDEPYQILPDASPYAMKGTRPDKRLGAPPGAGSLRNFLTHCTGCQICVATCPSQMLKPSITQWGLAGFMQPYLEFKVGFCLKDCVACTRVCPTGALHSLTIEQKHVSKIGTALFRKELCVVTKDETDCSACGEHCPVTAIEMIPYKEEKHLYIPYVHEDVCIGCGACEHICPVEPFKALVIQGLKTHTVAKVFDDSMRLYVPQTPVAPTEPPAELDNPFPF